MTPQEHKQEAENQLGKMKRYSGLGREYAFQEAVVHALLAAIPETREDKWNAVGHYPLPAHETSRPD